MRRARMLRSVGGQGPAFADQVPFIMSFSCKNLSLLCVLFALSVTAQCSEIADDPPGFWDPIWTYSCQYNQIHKFNSCQRLSYNSSDPNAPARVPEKVCWLTCDTYGALWPYPTIKTQLGSETAPFLPRNVRVTSVITPSENVTGMVQEAVNIMIGHIHKLYDLGLADSPFPSASSDNPRARNGEQNTVELALLVLNGDTKITLDTNESYTIQIQKEQSNPNDPVVVRVYITGITYFGLRHGLETLTQLMAFDEDTQFLQIVNQVDIADKPTYRFRGLLIDTGRNFIPFEDLRRMVDGMAYNKLNMFHWHLSDSNSIPFMSKRVPQVTKYGTFGKNKVYRPEEIAEFIRYANIRGVKVIPELDAPSHAGNGWQWGPLEGLGELSLCVNAEPYVEYCIQPPCGQLNPLNENTTEILGKLFQDYLDVFDRDLFHMGNDEVSTKCWDKYPELMDWIDQQNSSMMGLWGHFQERSLQKLKDANEGQPITPIVWTSDMTENGREYLSPDEYTIHIWSETTEEAAMRNIFQDGYSVIMSNKDVMYLDHGYGPWRGNVSNVRLNYWQGMYAYDILKIIESVVGTAKANEMLNAGKIWGGLAALWSEKVDKQNMDMKLWPRGAAAAERFWSNPSQEPRRAYPRLILHRERMIQRGHQPDTLLPEACHYIWGFCDNNW